MRRYNPSEDPSYEPGWDLYYDMHPESTPYGTFSKPKKPKLRAIEELELENIQLKTKLENMRSTAAYVLDAQSLSYYFDSLISQLGEPVHCKIIDNRDYSGESQDYLNTITREAMDCIRNVWWKTTWGGYTEDYPDKMGVITSHLTFRVMENELHRPRPEIIDTATYLIGRTRERWETHERFSSPSYIVRATAINDWGRYSFDCWRISTVVD